MAKTSRDPERRFERQSLHFALSADMLCVATIDGYFTDVNPALASTLGYREDELYSQPFISFVHPDDVASTETAVKFAGYDTERFIQFGGIDRVAQGEYTGWQGYGYLERGVSFRMGHTTLQPYGALQYIHLRQYGYTETGAGALNLSVGGLDADSLRSLLGARLQYNRGYAGGRLTPEVRALWLHEFLDTYTVVNSSIGGGSFAVSGLDLGRDWALLGAGVRYGLARGWSLYGNYDAQVNDRQVFHLGSGGVDYQW